MTTKPPKALLIESDLSAALAKLKQRWRKALGLPLGPEKEADALARIEMVVSDYCHLLRQVELSQKGSLKKRVAYATENLLDAFEARVAGLIRSLARSKKDYTPSQILTMAAKFSVWKPLAETILLYWKPKKAGKFRPICSFGPLRKAQGFMVRDMLKIAGVEAETNFARKGFGGERALTQKISSLMKEDKDWWWTPDIKSAFQSMHRGHFRWLAMDRRLLLNVVYIGECAKVEVKLPENVEALSAYLKEAYPNITDGTSPKDIAKLMIRQGLPQGSVISPLLAGALIVRVWKGVSNRGADMLLWHDDLHIGAETKTQITHIKEQLTNKMSSLPAGPIEFHEASILPKISWQVQALGYKFLPERGHGTCEDGTRPVHVKPGKKRIEEFKGRLKKRLAKAPNSDLFQAAEAYHRAWYASQVAWTKVPQHSHSVSLGITFSYVTDFINGLPMGGGWGGEEA